MFQTSIFGLDDKSHLRDVIGNDLTKLNTIQAAKDVCAVLQSDGGTTTKGILLECTNLPPYKPDIRKHISAPIYDILTAIEAQLPNAVQPQYL